MRADVTLAQQKIVSIDHRVARDTECRRQFSRGRKPQPCMQAAFHDGGPQLPMQIAPQLAGSAQGQVDGEVEWSLVWIHRNLYLWFFRVPIMSYIFGAVISQTELDLCTLRRTRSVRTGRPKVVSSAFGKRGQAAW